MRPIHTHMDGQKTNKTKLIILERIQRTIILIYNGKKMEKSTATFKNTVYIFKLNMFLSNNSVIILEIFMQRILKLTSTQNTVHNVYVSFIHNHQKLSQSKSSSIGEWILKLEYFYTVEYYSQIKRGEL